MTPSSTQLTEDEFDATYPLVTNHIHPHATWAFGDGPGCLFDTHGHELAFVRHQDPRAIWTLLDGDDGNLYVVSGYRIVNRIGYLISTVPFSDGSDIEVPILFDSDE